MNERLHEQWTFIARLWIETSDAVRRARQHPQLSQFVTELALTVVGTRYRAVGPDGLYADLPVIERFVEQHRQENWTTEALVQGSDTGLDALQALVVGAHEDLSRSRPGLELVVLQHYLAALIDPRLTGFVEPATIGVDTAIAIGERALSLDEPHSFPVMKAAAEAIDTGGTAQVDWLADPAPLHFNVTRAHCILCGLDALWPQKEDGGRQIEGHRSSPEHKYWADRGGRPACPPTEVDAMFPTASVTMGEVVRPLRQRSSTRGQPDASLFAKAVFQEARDAAYRGVAWSRLSQGDNMELIMSVVGTRYRALGVQATIEAKDSIDALVAQQHQQFARQRPKREDIDALVVIEIFASRIAEVLGGPGLSQDDRRRLIGLLLHGMVNSEYEDYLYPNPVTEEAAIHVLNTVSGTREPGAYPVMLATSTALETGSPAPINWLAEGDWRELRVRAVRSSCSCGVDFFWPDGGDNGAWIADHLQNMLHNFWMDRGGRGDGSLNAELDNFLGPTSGSLKV